MSDENVLHAHSPLGPSAAEGWMTCAGYVNANAGLPDFDSEVAAEGTMAHLISDICLLTGLDASDFIGATLKVKDWTFGWDEDDAELLQRGIDYVRDLPGQFFGEQRVDISPFTLPGQFGTLDRAIWDGDTLIVIDLKWGRGIPVSAVENKQLRLYALGLWQILGRPPLTRIILIIDQPRHAGGGGIWETTLNDLLAFAEEARAAALATQQPDAPRTASLKGCLWCKRRRVKYGCDTFDEYMLEVLGLTPDELDYDILIGGALMLPQIMNPERRSLILSHAGMIENWLENLAAQELADAETGDPTPGRKMVLGRATAAQWKDKAAAETAVRKALGNKGFKEVVKTPKQVLALLPTPESQEEVLPLIKPGEKKPEMVDESDARSVVESTAALAAELDDL